ncbi:MAG: phosphomethylpyrimidine synthase ThiC, partial [Vicinamibacterales bacterium]
MFDPTIHPHHQFDPLPPLGADPSSTAAGTTPGSFAKPPQIAPGLAGRWTFSSPDTAGMPQPSDKTAWDFLPERWESAECGMRNAESGGNAECGVRSAEFQNAPHANHSALRTPHSALEEVVFEQSDGTLRRVRCPRSFEPITQLEHARLGIITPEMQRVAEREPHLTPAQVRDEVAAGRMIIPANKVHLGYQLDAMCIGRASKTKINANMGASPVSSGTAEELEKLAWAVRWGADTVMDLSTGGNLDECREAIIQNSTVPIGTVPIYSMIIGRRIEDLNCDTILKVIEHQAKQGVDYF